MKKFNAIEKNEKWQESQKSWQQLELEQVEEQVISDKLNELEPQETWCPCCGGNMNITDDECLICGF